MSAVAEALSTSGLAATISKGRWRIRLRTVEYSCQLVSSRPGPTRRRSCSSRMSTRQDRSRKVCWSIVVPDRWHPKINTTRRSLGRARTIERAERLANASVLRLNRGSSSRSLCRDGSTLEDACATTLDCPLYGGLPPSMPFLMRSAAKDAHVTESGTLDSGWRLAVGDNRLHEGPTVGRGACRRPREDRGPANSGRQPSCVSRRADHGSHPAGPPGS